MFHPFLFHSDFHSRHSRDVLADAMALAAALKVEQDLQRKWREEKEEQASKADVERQDYAKP